MRCLITPPRLSFSLSAKALPDLKIPASHVQSQKLLLLFWLGTGQGSAELGQTEGWLGAQHGWWAGPVPPGLRAVACRSRAWVGSHSAFRQMYGLTVSCPGQGTLHQLAAAGARGCVDQLTSFNRDEFPVCASSGQKALLL